ncbi:MAG: ABC transporter permease [Thermoleophilia bacterium]|nr:ABC transporter permease [Thermoleophilia bacterium]
MSLLAYAARRLLWTVPLLVGVLLATYALLRGSGGSPFRPPEGYIGVPETYERLLRRHYHLDEPWLVEFAYWLENVFTLEFGPSLVLRELDVAAIVRDSLPVTLELVALSAAWAVPAGIALGVWGATSRSRLADLLATATATLLLVVPVFFVAFALRQYAFADWGLVPLGWDGWRSKVLPVLALGLPPVGYVARLIRVAMAEALQEDYVRTAVAMGLRRWRIVWVHALRNALAPVVAAGIPMVALLVTGAFFVERAFAVPGVSAFFVEAARTRDYPIVMNLTAALAVVVLAANLVSDVLLALVDPRVRDQVGREGS